jgi:hypothetical protein
MQIIIYDYRDSVVLQQPKLRAKRVSLRLKQRHGPRKIEGETMTQGISIQALTISATPSFKLWCAR